jgi:hypothetical protein
MMKKKLCYAFFRGKNFLEEAGIFYFQLLLKKIWFKFGNGVSFTTPLEGEKYHLIQVALET